MGCPQRPASESGCGVPAHVVCAVERRPDLVDRAVAHADWQPPQHARHGFRRMLVGGLGQELVPVGREGGRAQVPAQLAPRFDVVRAERSWWRGAAVDVAILVAGRLLLATLLDPGLDRRALLERPRLPLEGVVEPRAVLRGLASHIPPPLSADARPLAPANPPARRTV